MMYKKWFALCWIVGFVILGFWVSGSRVLAAPTTQEATPTEEAPRPRLPYERPEAAPYLGNSQNDTEALAISAPAISVPWSEIVFQSFRDLTSWDVYLTDENGSNHTRLTWDRHSDVRPHLNRGSTRIVFSSNRRGNYDIFSMNPDSSGLTQLTFNIQDDYAANWSPDGTRIVFQAYRDSQAEIYVMNADGSGQTRLTWDGDYDGLPAWSPDGNKIAFISRRTGGYRVYVMNSDGSGLIQLSNQAYSSNPVWSPSGSQIAYDADGDGDGFQELWLMDADGSNQRVVYDAGDNQDAVSGGWSPDGIYLSFTRISLIYYEGNWYWQDAYLYYYDTKYNSSGAISYASLEWNPDWQSTDGIPPTTSMDALPAQSPATFTLNWSGTDSGPSGFKNYDVQVRDGIGGNWVDWLIGTTATSGNFTGIGGQSYYFRVRGWDKASNFEAWPEDYDTSTRIETKPPVTTIYPMYAFLRQESIVRWFGYDPGDSGIASFDLQFKDSIDLDWTDLAMDTTLTAIKAPVEVGHTYNFRIRGIDKAQNQQIWHSSASNTTTIYNWAINSLVHDNTGVPVSDANIVTSPASFSSLSDRDGNYSNFSSETASEYTVSWSRDVYGELPETRYSSLVDQYIGVILPPIDNIILNSSFEAEEQFFGWHATGTLSPVVTDTLFHTGEYAAMLGASYPLDLTVYDGALGNLSYFDWVVDDNQQVYLIWESRSPEDIFFTTRDWDGNWSTPINITQDSSRSIQASLALDPDGLPNLVWRDFESNLIRYSRQNEDESWSPPVEISEIGSDFYQHPTILIDQPGNIHVFWYKNSYMSSSLYYATKAIGEDWTNPIIVANSVEPYDAQFILDKNNNIHLAWAKADGGIIYKKRDNYGNWSPPITISESGKTPSIDCDPQGNPHVVWLIRYQEIFANDVFYSRHTNGTWSLPINITVSPIVTSRSPKIYVDASNNGNIIWYDQRPTSGIYYSKCQAGLLCTSPVFLTEHPDTDSPNIEFKHANDIGILTWRDSSTRTLYYKILSGFGSWSKTMSVIETGGQTGLQTDGDGNFHFMWSEQYGYISYAKYLNSEHQNNSAIWQSLHIPITMTNPTLSYIYQLKGASKTGNTGLSVSITDEINSTEIISTSTNTSDWTHAWHNLSPWNGETITVTFNVHEEAGYPYAWAYIDEVTVGSANPDIWVTAVSKAFAALPGEIATYEFTYGNRGAFEAVGNQITATLPLGLTFLSANQPVILDGSKLVWETGNLPGESHGTPILVTVLVNEQAVLDSDLVVTVEIESESIELETANNSAQANIYIGKIVYLPLIER